MLTDYGKLSLVKAVEQKLQIKPSEQKIESLTNEDLKIAAEIYTYLIACPNNLWFKFWYSFYKDFFLTQPANQIILTLNRMTKITTPQNQDGKLRAEKLLQRTASLLSLKFEDIQSLLPEKQVSNGSVKNKNFNITKGAYLQIYLLAFLHNIFRFR